MDDEKTPDERRDVDTWEVVCIECHSIRRHGHWTVHRAESLTGKSTGYCDACFTRVKAAWSPYRIG
jgi:hypothetical protein